MNLWDNPRLLNLAANVLFGVAGFIVFCIVVLTAINSPLVPLRKVSVQGDLAHLDDKAIGAALAGQVSGNFFGVNLEAVRASLESLPWVRRVEVRRQWPDRLEVRIEEHVPFARWSDQRLVNSFGELFDGKFDASLPQLGGPAGSEAEVTRRYREFARIVAPLELDIAQLVLSPRYAWQMKLKGESQPGLTVELGRDQAKQTVEQRLERFVAIYPRTLATLNRRLDHIDLRYPNGFALRVPGLQDPDRQKKAGSA